MFVRIVTLCLFAAYPFAIWQLLARGMTSAAALVLAAGALLGALSKRSTASCACAAAAVVLAVCATVFGATSALKLYPVFVNAALFLLFAASLKNTPVVEKLARLKNKNLPLHAVIYCRRVTVAWCIFFAANGLVALDSALWRSDAWWALYNGAVSYVLIGLMFAVEFGVRLFVERKHTANGELP